MKKEYHMLMELKNGGSNQVIVGRNTSILLKEICESYFIPYSIETYENNELIHFESQATYGEEI
jgi:hypothetical protein